jgi:hypothetical protein
MMAEPSSKFEMQSADETARLRDGARDTLVNVFGDMAGSEALTRALVAERTERRDQALIWLDVYRSICAAEHDSTNPEIVRI